MIRVRRTLAAAAALSAFALAAAVPAATLLPAAPAAAADDAPSAGGVEWIETWDAGKKAGLAQKKVLFVYVHRVNPG
ncbi:MAG: hypothetical protein HMLKMBBP_02101 [Planctomycetes bacterium]|nr:hypothetical protein [Planctomycetota bacterium]